ncbi:hypothetical protein TKK_0011731 [Trichogramma kaykai]|uniref:Uncharacterized protein n=1 Tax=Trichogramma kaykai TaxID=54128 RepID=A0ABD2WQ80_9HYME
MPDVLNRTGDLVPTACRCPADSDLVVPLPERQDLLAFYRFNGTEMRVTNLNLSDCNSQESSFALGKSILEDLEMPLDAKLRLLDIVPYTRGYIIIFLQVTDANSKPLKTVEAYYHSRYKRYRGTNLPRWVDLPWDITGLSERIRSGLKWNMKIFGVSSLAAI